MVTTPVRGKKSPTFSDCRDFYGAGKSGRIHGYFEGLWCFCPSCLYHFYKKTHGRSKIEWENFFFVWLLIQKGKTRIEKGKEVFRADWKFAEDLILKISGRKFLKYKKGTRDEKYRMAARYKKIISTAKKEKFDLVVYFNSNWEKINEAIARKAILKATKKVLYMDEKLLKKIREFSKEKRGASLGQLERKFTKKKAHLVSLLSLYGRDMGLCLRHDNKFYPWANEEAALRNPMNEILGEIKKSLWMVKDAGNS